MGVGGGGGIINYCHSNGPVFVNYFGTQKFRFLVLLYPQ